MALSFASCADVVKTWEVVGDSGIQPRHAFEAQSSAVTCVCWNHNNQVLASCNHDGLIALSHFEGKLLGVLPPQTSQQTVARRESIRSIHFSNGSRYLCSGGTEMVVKVWDLKKKDKIRSFRGHSAPVNIVSFNADDRYIASGSDAGDVVLHNTTSSDKQGVALRPARGAEPVSALAYSPHAPNELGVASTAGSVMLWDTGSAALVLDLPHKHGPARGVAAGGTAYGTCSSLVFSPINQKLLVTAGEDGVLLCFDVREAKVVKSFVGNGAITAMDMARDGFSIAAGTAGGELVLRDLRSEGVVSTVNGHHPERVACLRFQNSGAGGAARRSRDRSGGSGGSSAGRGAGATPANAVRDPVVPSSGSRALARAPAAHSAAAAAPKAALPQPQSAVPPSNLAPDAGGSAGAGNVAGCASGAKATPPLALPASASTLSAAVPSSSSPSRARAPPPSSAAAAAADVLQSVVALGPAGGLEPAPRTVRPLGSPASSAATTVPKALEPPASMPRYGEFGSGSGAGLGQAADAKAVAAVALAPAPASAAPAAPAPAPTSGAGLFQRALLESVVEDSLSEFRADMQRDVQNLHLDMLRQFEIQQNQVTGILEQFTARWSNLVAENEELRKENELLRNIDF